MDFISREKAFSLHKYNSVAKLFLTLPVNTFYSSTPYNATLESSKKGWNWPIWIGSCTQLGVLM